MPRKKQPSPQPQMLVARIESFEQSYYLAVNRQPRVLVQDEAIINIAGYIERISPKLKQHLDQRIDISLACARSYSTNEPAEGPFLLLMNLSNRQRSCMAYLPSAAFWSIPRMIDTNRITHIEARFEPLQHGSGNLISINLMPASQLPEF